MTSALEFGNECGSFLNQDMLKIQVNFLRWALHFLFSYKLRIYINAQRCVLPGSFQVDLLLP